MRNLENLTISYASKDSLIECIRGQFDSVFDFARVEKLLSKLKDGLSFYIEAPYIDSHYRDTYYSYYAAKFQNYERNCLRIHIFSESIESIEDNDERYLGYFIIRPLPEHPLGRSFIAPKAFTSDNFICCLCHQTVNFQGINLSLDAFPHVVQDEETHKCAESAVWMLLSYFGTKFCSHSTLLPSEIRRKIDSISLHRLLPSNGLTLEEITVCLNSVNHNCLYYLFDKNNPETFLYFIVMRIYIESGMPFIVAYTDKDDNNGHVVLAIGHENIGFDFVKNTFSGMSDKCWHDVSIYKKNLVFMDDNFSPYEIDNCEGVIERYKKHSGENKSSDGIEYFIRGFIVPTHKHMHMDALAAYKLVNTIFSEELSGLSTVKTEENKWITRLFLTSSKDFKNSLIDDSFMVEDHRNYFLTKLLPRFIWVCEIYDEDSYIPNNNNEQVCSGILVLDATEVGSLNSVLAYFVKNLRYENCGTYLLPNETNLIFRKKTYQHNLKGAWNEWQS